MKLAKENDINFMKDFEISQILFNMLKIMKNGCIDTKDWEILSMSASLLNEIC